MVIPLETNLTVIFWNTLSNVISNLPIFILVIWGVRILAKKIDIGFSNLIKNIPNWISDYDKLKMKHYQIERALHKRDI